MTEVLEPEVRMPRWWQVLRRVVVFVLGVTLIVDSIIQHTTAGRLIAGLIMIGVLPLDDLVLMLRRRGVSR